MLSDLEKLKERHSIEVPGAVLLFLANILKDRQIALYAAIEIAHEEGADTTELELSSEANEVVGGMFLQFIDEKLGADILSNLTGDTVDLSKILN